MSEIKGEEINAEGEKGLNEEQQEFLEYLENKFKDRYTEADKDFKIVWQNDLPPPPIFVNWEMKSENRMNSNYRRGYKDYRVRDTKQKRYWNLYNRPGRKAY